MNRKRKPGKKRKLALRRTTVRELSSSDLSGVVGGLLDGPDRNYTANCNDGGDDGDDDLSAKCYGHAYTGGCRGL